MIEAVAIIYKPSLGGSQTKPHADEIGFYMPRVLSFAPVPAAKAKPERDNERERT